MIVFNNDKLGKTIAGAGFNRRKMCKMIGISEMTLRRYIKGDRDIPVVTMVAIANALKIDKSEIGNLFFDNTNE